MNDHKEFSRLCKRLEHTIANLVDAAHHDPHIRIKADSIADDGQITVISSRHHSTNVRNILYGGRF
jgi:hypothetical protein